MRRIILLLSLAALLLLTNSALAMFSTSYHLDWFTPMTTGGGGPASSTNYAVNVSIGQTAISASGSADYVIGLGYWYGAAAQYHIYLPLILRQ